MDNSAILLISLTIVIAVACLVCAENKKKDTTFDQRNPLLKMRDLMLKEPMEKGTGIKKSFGENKVYGVLMEMGFPKGAVSLVTLIDGTTSLYFETGGGIIGGGGQENVRKLTIPFVKKANEIFSNFKRTSEFPLPKKNFWTFYVLTETGIYSAMVKEKVLKKVNHPLSEYAYMGNEIITQLRLIEEKRGRSFSNEELLLEAVGNRNVPEIRNLLNKGLDINAGDKTGLTPLMAAAYLGDIEILNELIQKGAKLEAKDEEGYTALMFASNEGKLETVKRLIELGADVNAKDKNNSTPIMFAAQHGHNEVVKVLLENGADPDFTGNHGLSAKGFAKQNGLKETEKIMKEFKK